MKNKSIHMFKSFVTGLLVVAMVLVTIGFAPNAALAASKPTLSKAAASIEVGQSLTLKVNHKIKGSTYKWSSSDTEIATVSKNGVVEGIAEGDATITCKVKAAKKTYTLKCDVTVTAAEVAEDTDTTPAKDTPATDTTTTETPKADLSNAVETPIKSITYDFTMTGVKDATTLSYQATPQNWANTNNDISVTKDGDYSITVDFGNTSGLYNVGYIKTIAGCPIIVKLNKITVNGTYVINYTAEVKAGEEGKNGFANIWNITDGGTKIAEGTDSYLEFSKDKTIIKFFVVK